MVAIVQLVATLAVVGYQYGAVVLVAFVILPVYVFLPLILGPRMRRASDRLLEAKAELGSRVQEVIEAVKLIKVFGRERWAQQRAGKAFDHVFKRQLGVGRVQSTYTLNYAAYWMMVSFLYWFGGRQVLAGQLTVGELIALVWYLGLLDGPTRQLVTTHAQAQSALGAAERLEAFLARPAEAVDNDRKKDLAPGRHRVEFNEVSFRYSSEARDALDRVSFSVEPGMRVGIVGPSGAGKSTLAGLLSGLYEPQQGAICIGGEDIREYRLASLRQQVGIVLQETYLFSGSVSENILFGRLDAEEKEIRAACRAANAHRFIMDLPGGYDSEVGERGGNLSVGEKQRIAIARVVVRDPGILILDEATSALDSESERMVEDALERVAKGRTTFMITHRLRRVTHADLVLVLDNGRLVASGRHQDLLETSSVYGRLWRSGEREAAALAATDGTVLPVPDGNPLAAQSLVGTV
jgi:subfamily B ATP-binding cassette protein MsbA